MIQPTAPTTQADGTTMTNPLRIHGVDVRCTVCGGQIEPCLGCRRIAAGIASKHLLRPEVSYAAGLSAEAAATRYEAGNWVRYQDGALTISLKLLG